MALPTVAVDDAITADTMNGLIRHVNGTPSRAIFTSSGSWTIPEGVQKFKVTLAGGGGTGGANTEVGGSEGEYTVVYGGPGGSGPMISAIFNAGGAGSAVTVTVGGVGAASSVLGLISNGGSNGGTYGSAGGHGAATFPPGQPAIFHTNMLYGPAVGVGYGQGGGPAAAGQPGIVIIEW